LEKKDAIDIGIVDARKIRRDRERGSSKRGKKATTRGRKIHSYHEREGSMNLESRAKLST
jgi:hypothetical protein